ncbi:MAG: methyltransferase domain-containing protein [Nitrospiraceae bacterium]|nr:methyltransferase domain-containing protein [Nitrospiraceae bacterium]MCB9776915.1 methyltransferase domain-containing protein [Nitrospiraceae bacterium]
MAQRPKQEFRQRELEILKARVSQVEVTRLYDRLAGVYDLWSHLTEAKARRRSLELADVQDGQQVLEVAVGTGMAFVEMVKNNPHGRNVGIDISEGMLEKARRRLREAGCEHYELSVGSALAIQADDHSFDVLLNNYMFDLLEEHDWPMVLKEFHRVLKPGGKLVVVSMTFGEKPGSGFYQRLYQLAPLLMGGCRAVRLSGPLAQFGFVVKVREYVQQLFFPSGVILAIKSDIQPMF